MPLLHPPSPPQHCCPCPCHCAAPRLLLLQRMVGCERGRLFVIGGRRHRRWSLSSSLVIVIGRRHRCWSSSTRSVVRCCCHCCCRHCRRWLLVGRSRSSWSAMVMTAIVMLCVVVLHAAAATAATGAVAVAFVAAPGDVLEVATVVHCCLHAEESQQGWTHQDTEGGRGGTHSLQGADPGGRCRRE